MFARKPPSLTYRQASRCAPMNSLEFKTFPYGMTIFLSIFPLAVVYSIIFGSIGLFEASIGIVVPCVFICFLNYVHVIFDKSTGVMLVHSVTLFKKVKDSVAISEIEAFNIVTGRGQYHHRGYICAITKNRQIQITSMGSLSRKKQQQLIEEIQRFLGIMINA